MRLPLPPPSDLLPLPLLRMPDDNDPPPFGVASKTTPSRIADRTHTIPWFSVSTTELRGWSGGTTDDDPFSKNLSPNSWNGSSSSHIPSSLKRSVNGLEDPFPDWSTTSSYPSDHSFFHKSPMTLSTRLTRSCLMLKYSMGTMSSFESDRTSTALDMLHTTDPLMAKTKSPTFIDVDPMGLSSSNLTNCTSPCFILKCIPTA
mmetsp:Transcript_5734/g.12616  ORF Transcript_5734/g.12616 Transcript_5734/m.12616 type:complete len:202 (-) Transcript_5734:734-1339(-)